MGQQVSSNGESKDNQKKIKISLNDNSIVTESYSSYKGVKSEHSESNEENSTDDTDTNINNEEIKVPTHFEWKDGGDTVYITGSFCNWTQWFLMNKIDNNLFQLTLVII